ncbi:MAG: histidine--tRNA ligase [Microthrixaceae bacterium]|nr:histidine--tRNA ligase [Microthrixaceae bacterium]MCB1010084.1 histidine--tRNA ligase [Microthrixaceae bacterium]MCB9386482.1 histidine--tRNA ligase [Microthrixaceae bacterium]
MSGDRPQKFQSLTGMRDVLWPDSARRRDLVDRFVATSRAAGYREVVPPLLEDLGVFERVGEATDVVTKEMYEFTDRDGTRVALRPEMTAGVVRAFVQHKPLTPWKVFYAGTNFRHERPQKGRYRSFDQVGVEVLGADDPDLDVEVIALAWYFFEAIGLRQVTLLLNTLGEHDDRVRYSEAVASHFDAHRAELSEASLATLERNPLRLLDSKRREERSVIETAPKIAEFLSPAAAEHFARVKAGLDALGVPYRIDERLVRGLDYYRRTTFEFTADALDAAQNAIGGGGRYDGLAEDLGGKPTDGIGFALGVDRILLAAEAEGVLGEPESNLDVFVVDLTDGSQARDITHELRAAGLSADRRFGGGSMKAQMRSADRSGALYAVIVGEDEVAAAAVTLRRLRDHSDTAGDSAQQSVPRSELVARLAARSSETSQVRPDE